MLYRPRLPRPVEFFLIILPLLIRVQLGFVVRGKGFNLLLIDVDSEIAVVLRRGLQTLRGNQELPGGEPAAGVDDHILYGAGGMIKNYVVNLS